MRNFALTAAAVCFASCSLHSTAALAETFSLSASGFDVNTGYTTVASFNLTGVPDAVAGAYDITGGSGTVTMTSTAGSMVQNLTLFLPSGTSSSYQQASFDSGNINYSYDNVVYPGGTQLNLAGGLELDQYGLLFTNASSQFNIFGTGGYSFTNGDILYGFSSPLQGFSLVDTTSGVTPEPSSIALLGTGLLGAAGLMRRRYAAR